MELVRKSFDAIGRGDLDALLELYDPNIKFEPLTGTRVETGGYRGHQGVRQYFEEADEVWDEVRKLPRRQAQATVLHYVDQLSVAEIAEVMGVSPGAVKAHLHKARAHLSRRLETWGEETT